MINYKELKMLDTSTENALKNLIKPLSNNAKFYRSVMDNCSEYMVKHNGNKFWLFNNWIIAEWKNCQHSNPFESWKHPSADSAKEHFKSISFDDNY